MKISSQTESVQAKDQQIFRLLSNCSHFGKFLPEQIKDWTATEDYCRFSFQGMITLTLRITEKTEFSKIIFQAENDHHIPVSIAILIDGKNAGSDVSVETDIEVPPFLSGMVKKPLQNFVDMLVQKIKSEAEKQVL